MEYFTVDTLRAQLPLRFVCGELGVELDDDGRGLCPFHDDNRPSFQLWTNPEGVEKWRCWSCGVHGDVYDLVRKAEGISFPEAVARCRDFAKRVPQSYEGHRPSPRIRPAPDPNWYGLLTESQHRLEDQIGGEWGWGLDVNGNLLFPHYDQTGQLTGVKVRASSGQKWSWPGSSYPRLYGAWRQRTSESVFLAEGETDAVWASIALQSADLENPPHVLALPAGIHTFQQSYLEDLPFPGSIYLAFDADTQGYEGASSWLAILSDHPRLYVCYLPEGEDLRSAEPDIAELLRDAERV